MAKVDLNTAIRNLVAVEVERTLEPYRQLLERLEQFVGGAPARRGPGRPPKAGGRGRPGRKAAKAGTGDASKFKVGQAVKYRQGRGEFEATVAAVDTEKNLVSLERSKDGKKVDRPASKIYPA
ncbi:MAG TPA: hypothetical protein VGK67_10340 [Myxococcales bacterium]|jgi:sRNA-binding protein